MTQPTSCEAIALDPSDNVATALRALEPGAVSVRCGEQISVVTAAEPIPMGHKLALTALDVGAPIRKYGSVIGLATAAIKPGAHVHVHNLRSRRARAG
ncbi:MAG TPA: UxaA family hydrolase [Acetobacteraceae bacterium]